MKLLIITQKVDINDDVLGFFHDWILEFAKNCEKVTVICLEKGKYDLPDNVRVYRLGKEKKLKVETPCQGVCTGQKVFKRIKYLFNFYKLIWKHRKNYDRVFVHMIPMYAIVGAPVWKILNKRIGLWYAHGHVSLALKVAEKLVGDIFTSTKEGCRINSDKIQIVGQGIDTEKFFTQAWKTKNDYFNIISIGRIAPIKDYETLIRVIDILVNDNGRENIRVKIIGGTLLAEHKSYSAKLKQLVKDKKLEDYIKFTGSVPYSNILSYIQSANLFASTSRTGSLDKVMLEAMSCRVPVIACNEAVKDVLGDYVDDLMYKKGDSDKLARKIERLMNLSGEERADLGNNLREVVVREHGIGGLIKKILNK